MILRRLALRDFRRFASFEAHFSPGLNVVFGDNEAGKSTLREALAVALFQDPKTTDRKVLGLRRWGAPELFAVELDFEAAGKTYALVKDFEAKSARLVERDPAGGEIVRTDARSIEAVVRDRLGLGSRAVFDSTARITQRDITRLRGARGIADSLQRLVTGGESDVQLSRVLEELDRAQSALRSRAASRPGPLAVLPGQLAARESALQEKRRALAHLEAARAELASVEAELAAARRELAQQEALEADCAARLRLVDQLAEASELAERLGARVERAREIAAAVGRHERALAAHVAELAAPPALLAEIATLEARVIDGETDAPAGSGERPARPALLVVGVLLALGGFLGGLTWPPAYALLLIGTGLLAWELLRPHAEGVEPAGSRESAERLRAILAELGCSAQELRAHRHAEEALRERLSAERARLAGLLGGQTIADLEAERKAASRKARDLAEALDEPRLRLAALDQLAYQRLLRSLQACRARVQALEARAEELRVAVRAGQLGVDEVHALEEEVEELSGRLAAAERRRRVLAVAREVLDEARAATMASASDVLAEDLGGLVREITRGRYRQVRVGAADLAIEVFAPERGDYVPVTLEGELSQGTVEQVYLAARVALTRLLANDRKPPLILDDPFVSFDAPRTAAVLALCRRLAAEHQTLLFTCREAYRAQADHLIELPPA